MTKTKIIKLDSKSPDQRVILETAGLLESGGLVVFPTETVYGIAANLLNAGAIKRLNKIKARPGNKQYSIHIADKSDMDSYAVDILPRAYKMAEVFWPGPLTMVLNAPDNKTVGLRMPKNEIAHSLLRRCDFPIVAPSANRGGNAAPATAEEAYNDLADSVDLILDGGPAELGAESTVIDARTLPFKVLREGFLKSGTVLDIASVKTVLFVCTGNSCRSVMAEYLLKKKLADSGRRDVEVISAGTLAFLGMGPTRETLALIRDIEMDASEHRAQRLTPSLVKMSDIILVMERKHKEDVIRQEPQARGRVHVLGEYAGLERKESEVADPIGRSQDFYKMSFQKIKAAIEKMEI